MHPEPQASSSTKKLAGSIFPSQQPLRCQEKTKYLSGGNQSWQQEAEGRSAVEKEHAQPRQGTFPGPLTCCQGPASTALASMQTSVGAGKQAPSGTTPLQSCPRQTLSISTAPTKGGLPSTHADQMVRRARPRQSSSYPALFSNTLKPSGKGGGAGTWQ